MRKLIAILDANVILRYILGDDLDQARQAKDLIENAPAGSLFLHALIIAEAIWIMKGHYGISRTDSVIGIQRLLANRSIRTEPVLDDAVIRYSSTSVDFADCLLAALAKSQGISVATFDKDYRKFSDIRAVIPSAVMPLVL